MSHGLIGAIRAIPGTIAGSVRDHDTWAIRLVFIAGIVTILHKAGVPVPYYASVFAVTLGIAALLYEMGATTHALRAFWSGRIVGAVGWTLVWAVAFLYSMNQWIGAASENEAGKSNVHKAAYVQTADTRDQMRRAAAEVDRLEKRLAMQPQRTAEAAQAAIDNAMAHKWWRTTKGCTATLGPQTREFCSAYASAVADKAGATEALTLKTELKAAKDELAKAQSAVASAPAEFTEARNDLVILTKFGGLAEDDARVLNALGSIIAVSIFLSLATALRELEHLRQTQRRVPLFRFAWLRRLIWGEDAEAHSGDVAVRKATIGELMARRA